MCEPIISAGRARLAPGQRHVQVAREVVRDLQIERLGPVAHHVVRDLLAFAVGRARDTRLVERASHSSSRKRSRPRELAGCYP